MNRMTKLLTLGVAAIIVLSGSTQVFALCPTPEGAQHYGAHIINCPDSRPVAGYIGQVGVPPGQITTPPASANSLGIDVICEDGTPGVNNGQFVQCQGEAGVIGDGLVTISFDWGNQPSPQGCPDPSGLPGVGRNFFQVVCNNGASVLATVAYDTGFAAFPVDFAHPFNPADGTFDMPAATNAGGIKLASFNRAGGQDTACIDQTVLPHLYSECDPTSAASAFGLTCVDSTPSLAAGANLYAMFGPCNQLPQDLRTTPSGPWVQQATTPSGVARCVSYPSPNPGGCAWIGTTVSLGGLDTGAIAAWVEVNALAATDKVKIDSAAFNQGKLAVAFSTESEALTVGFNVYAGSTKLNTGLIAAKGTGSNSYSFEVGRGAVKSSKTVTVEAVKSDGSVVKTAPFNVK